MAKAKQQPKKTLYYAFFCGDNLGEADGFFTITDGKLELVDCWSLNDAHWRGEYMTGLFTWAGVEVKKLPEKYNDEGEKLLCENWGLDYSSDEGKFEHPDFEGEREELCLEFREGTSDKVYELEIYPYGRTWTVEARYGRRGSDLKLETKIEGVSYNDAKTLYDKTVQQKLKKGYKEA